MTKFRRIVFILTLLPVLLALTLLLMLFAGLHVVEGSSSALMPSEASSDQQIAILVDDFAPQPIQGTQFWPHNRLGGDRGPIDGPGSGSVDWKKGVVTAAITAGTDTWRGVWTSLNHPIRDCTPLNFSSIFPSQIKPQYQGRITGLWIHVLDGQGTFQVDLQNGENTFCPPQITKWTSENVILSGGQQDISFDLPPDLAEIQNLNWIVKGNTGDFVVVDQVVLTATLPHLDTPEEQAFLWSYAMLLANWDRASGLTRDHAYYAANEFDNVSASGIQAAAAVMAWHLGFIDQASVTQIVTKTTQALLALPRCHGLWPHFVNKGQIISGTEWSSIDTVIAIVALLEAREPLGLDTTSVEEVLAGIDWDALILGNGSISHGYVTDCSQRIEDPQGGVEGGWRDFGTESWLVNLGYAAATDNVADFDHTPLTYNGSGFIDELAWLLVPPPCRDQWRTGWRDNRQQAADCQLAYYQCQAADAADCQYCRDHPCYDQLGLFGLSAAEVPDLSAVPYTQTYQAFGVGGEISPMDGIDLLGHAVIVPHYAGLIASLRPTQAITLWNWMEAEELFTPLNNVESLMFTDEPTSCEQVVWNTLKGSWNLSLHTLGWGRLVARDDNPLYKGMWANDVLRPGYMIMSCGALDGITIDPMEAVGDWHVVMGTRAISAILTTVTGYNGQAVRLSYNLSTTSGITDNWVQLRRDFDPPLDLSAGDHLRFFHQGTTTNTLEVGLVSAAGENYFGSSWNQATHVPTWTYATWDLRDFQKDGQPFPDDFSQVKALFISVVNTADGVGGTGSFTVDELQYLNIATRTVPSDFEFVTANPTVTQQAAAWIAARQRPGGLLKSWQEEPDDLAWLYDQALGLIVLSETDLLRADQLAAKLHELQNLDGSWYVGYHYSATASITTTWITTTQPVGANAWTVYALMRYFLKSGASTAYQDALEGADWLANLQRQRSDGSLPALPGETTAPTEPNLDAWWAFQATGYQTEANLLRDFLLKQVWDWDSDMGRFKSDPDRYQIFLDNQTWGAAFLRAIDRDEDACRALSYAQWTLVTTTSDGSICGFDGAGPFSVWNEGTLQYVAAHGENSQFYWEQMVGQQAPDGGMPNSRDSFRGYIVWLSPWHGVAPTAWLYFAGTGGPFHVIHDISPSNVNISGPTSGVIQTSYTFTATVSPVTATQPITYVWQATGQTPPVTHTGGLSDTVTFAWRTPGTQSITVMVTNITGTVTATHVITINAPPTGVVIAGPTKGIVHASHTFTATVSPVTVTQPITYIWQATGQDNPTTHTSGLSDTVTFSWTTPGAQVVTVTVTNAGGVVTDTHAITVNLRIYLPVVVRLYVTPPSAYLPPRPAYPGRF